MGSHSRLDQMNKITCLLAHVFTCLIGHFSFGIHALGPAYAGDKFVRFKELPPAHVTARVSGSLTITCSATGSPTPVTAWYKNGHKVAGSDASPGGLGESVAKLVLSCISEDDAGLYECRSHAGGQEVVVGTKVEVVGHKPLSACVPRSLQGSAPAITGWFSTVMIQSGDTAKLPCHVEGDSGGHSVIWRDADGSPISASGRYRLDGTDLVINDASWADMGRFTCTAQNGFGVDMVSTFLYPLAPTFY